jgi:hypothetical protein
VGFGAHLRGPRRRAGADSVRDHAPQRGLDFSDEAGIGTVPVLIVYLLANLALPLHILGTNRAALASSSTSSGR